MAKVIALFNQAGGVGKTSLVLNLGYSLSTSKKDGHVLLVDMDPQASLRRFPGTNLPTSRSNQDVPFG